MSIYDICSFGLDATRKLCRVWFKGFFGKLIIAAGQIVAWKFLSSTESKIVAGFCVFCLFVLLMIKIIIMDKQNKVIKNSIDARHSDSLKNILTLNIVISTLSIFVITIPIAWVLQLMVFVKYRSLVRKQKSLQKNK